MLVDPPIEDVRLVVCLGLWLFSLAVAFIRRRFLSRTTSQDCEMAARSEVDVSDTDRDLFWALSNPEVVAREARRPVVDDHRGPSPTAESAVFADARRREGQQARQQGGAGAQGGTGAQAPHEPAYDIHPSPGGSAFQARVDARVRERQDDGDLRRSPSAPRDEYPRYGSPARSERSHGSRRSGRSHKSQRSHRSRDSHGSHRSHGSRRSHRTSDSRDSRDTHDRRDDRQDEYEPSPLRGEALRLEKQAALLDLERLRISGVVLSRGYDMSDRLEDMRFEIQKHEAALDEKQMVSWMKSCLRVGLTGIEVGNKKFGPFLALDGWSAEITTDMEKFDMPMARLYRKYGRRSTMSPEMELAWIIFGSMGMFHFRQKGGAMLAAMNPAAAAEPAEFGTFTAEPQPEAAPPGPAAGPLPPTSQRKMSAPDF